MSWIRNLWQGKSKNSDNIRSGFDRFLKNDYQVLLEKQFALICSVPLYMQAIPTSNNSNGQNQEEYHIHKKLESEQYEPTAFIHCEQRRLEYRIYKKPEESEKEIYKRLERYS